MAFSFRLRPSRRGGPAAREQDQTVGWFELFYDLVIVAAAGLTNDAFGYILTAVDWQSFKRYEYISRTSLGERTGEIFVAEALKLVAEADARSPRRTLRQTQAAASTFTRARCARALPPIRRTRTNAPP